MSLEKVFVLTMLFLWGAGTLEAQERQPPGQSYVYFSPGWFVGDQGGGETAMEFGGGGERRLVEGLGVGGDLGFLFPSGGFSEGIGHAAGPAMYQFGNLDRSQRTVPFLTGGASVFFREGAIGVGNLGGGVTRWLNDGLGLRFELRDHFRTFDAAHLLQFRVGLSFR